jgi:hypothetical protein
VVVAIGAVGVPIEDVEIGAVVSMARRVVVDEEPPVASLGSMGTTDTSALEPTVEDVVELVLVAIVEFESALISEAADGEFCSTTAVVSAAGESPGPVVHQGAPPRIERQIAPTVTIFDFVQPLLLDGWDGFANSVASACFVDIWESFAVEGKKAACASFTIPWPLATTFAVAVFASVLCASELPVPAAAAESLAAPMCLTAASRAKRASACTGSSRKLGGRSPAVNARFVAVRIS